MPRNTPNQKRIRSETTHCAYCERKLYDTGPQRRTIEHFYPLDMGKDLNKGWNKLIVCFRCNQLKGNKHPLYLVKYIKKQLDKPGHPLQYITDLQDIKLNVSRYHKQLEGYFIMRDLI
jgi:5-methylcytosine-specific restriction endonuclease McrA